MDCNTVFSFWLQNSHFDEETRAELEKIKDNPGEIEERFYRELEFGTVGFKEIFQEFHIK